MNRIQGKLFPVFFAIYMLCACAGMGMIAVFSGEDVHPDETQTKPAVLYYTDHVWPPDVSRLGEEYFCGYGTTRISELTPYYFLAGRVAAVARAPYNYRLFNVLLGWILAAVALTQCKKNPALALAFSLTPQLWYLFSYATSDAFDFFLAFLCLYQVLKPDSVLQKFLRGEDGDFETVSGHAGGGGILRRARRGAAGIRFLWPGILFGLTLLSKANYYLVPLWLFAYFLVRLRQTEGGRRRALFRRCLLLLGVSLAVFALRLAVDVSIYGWEKAGIVMEQMERYAFVEYKPSTPAARQAASLHLMQKGVPLGEMLFHTEFHTLLLWSFSGLYGAYAIGTNPLYYACYGVLFLILLALTACGAWRSGSKRMRAEFALAVVLMLFSYLLVILYSWIRDFQPQGRYLFPAIPVLCYGLSLNEELLRTKRFQVLALAIGGMSAASFLFIGVGRMCRF